MTWADRPGQPQKTTLYTRAMDNAAEPRLTRWVRLGNQPIVLLAYISSHDEMNKHSSANLVPGCRVLVWLRWRLV